MILVLVMRVSLRAVERGSMGQGRLYNRKERLDAETSHDTVECCSGGSGAYDRLVRSDRVR
jgi:hypothetical protein